MKSRSVLVLFFILCTAVFGLFSWPAPAQAAPGDLEARWFIEMTFVNNEPLANMTIEIYSESKTGLAVLQLTQDYPVNCHQVGTVEISNNIAVFDGRGYFKCNMPDFQKEVTALTRGELKLPESCTCKLAYGVADLTLAQTANNPIFAMPGLEFSAPVHAFGLANYRLSVDEAVAESELFLPKSQLQSGMSQFQQQGAGYAPTFSVDGVDLGSTPAFIAGKLEVPTNETTFYVGFNPNSGDLLLGKLGSLEIDPGCVGHGGI